MKYAIINKSDLLILGFYDSEEPTNEISWWGNYYLVADQHIHVSMPEGLDPDCIKAELVEDVITIVADNDKVAAKVLANKASRIDALNTATWATILTEACSVYGIDPIGKTRIEISILSMASHDTYQDMVSHPGSYVGAIFSDEATVLAYAEPKLAASSTYGLFRIGVLGAEAAQKAAIEAE